MEKDRAKAFLRLVDDIELTLLTIKAGLEEEIKHGSDRRRF